MKDSNNKYSLQDYFFNQSLKGFENKNNQIKRHYSNVCDEWLEVKIEKINDLISCRYNVVGCSFTVATTEAIARIIKNKTISEAILVLEEFKKFINNESKIIFKELRAFDIVKKHKSRKKCILFSLNVFLEEIKKINNKKND